MLMGDFDFKVVTSKRKRKSNRNTNNLDKCLHPFQAHLEVGFTSRASVIRRVTSAIEEIKNSEFFKLFSEDLFRDNKELKNIDIVTYGLGNFSLCASSRYQFAFILVLKDILRGSLLLYDPVFIAEEHEIVKHFDCFMIGENEEGKRQIDKKTIFFLPHCPKQLLNNLLWKNWTASLKHCIIVGNSINSIVQSHSDRFLKESLIYVYYASSCVQETTVNNCFRFPDIFNDLSIQVFLEQSILELPHTVTNFNQEPCYKEEDIEFIATSLDSQLIIST